jgi:hypothetical protein
LIKLQSIQGRQQAYWDVFMALDGYHNSLPILSNLLKYSQFNQQTPCLQEFCDIQQNWLLLSE